MSRRDHMDQAFAAAIEQQLASRAGSAPRRAAPSGLRRQAVVAVAVGVLVIAASVGVIAVTHRLLPVADSNPQPAPTIEVDGRAMRYVGTVTWSDAVATDPSTLRIDAAPYPVHGHVFNCGAYAVRPEVVATAASVTVLMNAYDFVPPPLPPNAHLGCGLVGRGPLPVVVHLAQPLGSRALIDRTDGKHHMALDPVTIPVPAALPAGFRPSSTIRDDEASGVAERIWFVISAKKGSYVDYTVSIGPAQSIRRSGLGRRIGTTTVHGRTATIWLDEGPYDWRQHITWPVPGGRAVDLASHGTIHNHRPLAEMERVAQSTPDP